MVEERVCGGGDFLVGNSIRSKIENVKLQVIVFSKSSQDVAKIFSDEKVFS